jgi:hypothetical protein
MAVLPMTQNAAVSYVGLMTTRRCSRDLEAESFPDDTAIRGRARDILNEMMDSTQLVRNSFLPTAFQWLKFIETWSRSESLTTRRPVR